MEKGEKGDQEVGMHYRWGKRSSLGHQLRKGDGEEQQRPAEIAEEQNFFLYAFPEYLVLTTAPLFPFAVDGCMN